MSEAEKLAISSNPLYEHISMLLNRSLEIDKEASDLFAKGSERFGAHLLAQARSIRGDALALAKIVAESWWPKDDDDDPCPCGETTGAGRSARPARHCGNFQ